jgi:hypothetical protein
MAGYSCLGRVLVITTLPLPQTIKQGENLAPPTSRQKQFDITTPERYPNINGFPSSCNAVGITLRTDLLLVDDALPGKPCPCDDRDSHPTTLLLPPGSALENGPQDLTTLLLPNLYAQLPQTNIHLLSKVSALGLSPVHFRGP